MTKKKKRSPENLGPIVVWGGGSFRLASALGKRKDCTI